MIKKKQHYVGREYLRPWSNKEQIFCIRNNRIFKSNLTGIAQENYFYEIQDLSQEEILLIKKLAIESSSELMKESYLSFLNNYLRVFQYENNFKHMINKENKDSVEHMFKKIKINYAEDYHAMVENIGNKYLYLIRESNINFFSDDKEDRIAFLFFVTLQYMRTKRRRNETIRAFENDNIGMQKIWPIMAHIYATNIAMSLHLDKAYQLILLTNNTNIKFITADQPLINTYGVNNKKELTQNELEFYYPITPKLSILITRDIQNVKIL